MSKSFKIFIAAAVMIAALTSCKSQFEALLNGSDVDAKWPAQGTANILVHQSL